MSWLAYGPLLSIVVGYLLFLFGVAYWAERSRRLRHPRLQMVAQESQRLSRMIHQLLDLSRIEAGRMEWRMESSTWARW